MGAAARSRVGEGLAPSRLSQRESRQRSQPAGWRTLAARVTCWQRGCLTAPSTIPEGDLIGVRLPRDLLEQPPGPGRCLLNTGDGQLMTVSVPPRKDSRGW